jgi:hypothetical protein
MDVCDSCPVCAVWQTRGPVGVEVTMSQLYGKGTPSMGTAVGKLYSLSLRLYSYIALLYVSNETYIALQVTNNDAAGERPAGP